MMIVCLQTKPPLWVFFKVYLRQSLREVKAHKPPPGTTHSSAILSTPRMANQILLVTPKPPPQGWHYQFLTPTC
jgi:hypothetical protein